MVVHLERCRRYDKSFAERQRRTEEFPRTCRDVAGDWGKCEDVFAKIVCMRALSRYVIKFCGKNFFAQILHQSAVAITKFCAKTFSRNHLHKSAVATMTQPTAMRYSEEDTNEQKSAMETMKQMDRKALSRR